MRSNPPSRDYSEGVNEATIIARILREQGEEATPSEVRAWLNGARPVPGRVRPVLHTVLENLEYHIQVAQTELLNDPTFIQTVLEEIIGMPDLARNKAASDMRRKRLGYATWRLAPRVPAACKRELRELARSLALSDKALMGMLLETTWHALRRMTTRMALTARIVHEERKPPTRRQVHQGRKRRLAQVERLVRRTHVPHKDERNARRARRPAPEIDTQEEPPESGEEE